MVLLEISKNICNIWKCTIQYLEQYTWIMTQILSDLQTNKDRVDRVPSLNRIFIGMDFIELNGSLDSSAQFRPKG
jgi:hypothetical protein